MSTAPPANTRKVGDRFQRAAEGGGLDEMGRFGMYLFELVATGLQDAPPVARGRREDRRPGAAAAPSPGHVTSVHANTVLSDDDGSLTVHTSVVDRSSTRRAGPRPRAPSGGEPQSQVMTGQAQVGGVVVSRLKGDIGKGVNLNAGQDA